MGGIFISIMTLERLLSKLKKVKNTLILLRNILLMNENPQRFIRIDTGGQRQEVFERIRKTLEKKGLSSK